MTARGAAIVVAAAAAAASAFVGGCASAPADPGDAAYLRYVEMYDRDGDGSIAAAEYDRGADAFKNLDRDGDGALTRKDFSVPVGPPVGIGAPYLFVRVFGGEGATTAGPEDVDAAFPNLDRDGDGALSADELASVGGPGAYPTLAAAADSDGDGRLLCDELRAFVAARDRDGDGRIALRERETAGSEPRVGAFIEGDRERAAPFRLRRHRGEGFVALDDFKGRPVGLVFGSFT
jgi:Ca2+-binding EF-hand superfamily protein